MSPARTRADEDAAGAVERLGVVNETVELVLEPAACAHARRRPPQGLQIPSRGWRREPGAGVSVQAGHRRHPLDRMGPSSVQADAPRPTRHQPAACVVKEVRPSAAPAAGPSTGVAGDSSPAPRCRARRRRGRAARYRARRVRRSDAAAAPSRAPGRRRRGWPASTASRTSRSGSPSGSAGAGPPFQAAISARIGGRARHRPHASEGPLSEILKWCAWDATRAVPPRQQTSWAPA